MAQIRISGKHLGDIAMPNYCERCLWIKLKLGNNLPFQIFPGIFSSIDSYTKKITNTYYAKNKILTNKLSSFGLEGKPVKVPHHSKFYIIDEETDIKLTGAPDEMLLKDNDEYTMLDYKTAKYTDSADHLLPIYDIQLNAYSLIADNIDMGPVTQIGLIYFEPFTDIEETTVEDYVHDEGFNIKFVGKYLPMELDTGKIKSLLVKIRELYDKTIMPKAKEKCKDCMCSTALVSLFDKDEFLSLK